MLQFRHHEKGGCCKWSLAWDSEKEVGIHNRTRQYMILCIILKRLPVNERESDLDWGSLGEYTA